MATTLPTQTKREQAYLQLQMQPLIQEMFAQEPKVLALFEKALSFDVPRDRWQAYSALKMAYESLPLSPDYYQTFVTAIDALLPDEFEGDMTNEED